MDRSFLSQAEVIEASRNFICIRLATYEDKEEAMYLKSLGAGRSGELENTVFCLLSPGGSERLTPARRGPFFRSASSMAEQLNRVAEQYKQTDTAVEPTLPIMTRFDLALNVAACDGLPLVVLRQSESNRETPIHHYLKSLAWHPELAGQFVYVRSSSNNDFKAIVGGKPESSTLVVEPGQFGMTGSVIAELDANMTQAQLKEELLTITRNFESIPKDHRSHVEIGIQLGIEWKTVVPATDPQSIRARERARGTSRREE